MKREEKQTRGLKIKQKSDEMNSSVHFFCGWIFMFAYEGLVELVRLESIIWLFVAFCCWDARLLIFRLVGGLERVLRSLPVWTGFTGSLWCRAGLRWCRACVYFSAVDFGSLEENEGWIWLDGQKLPLRFVGWITWIYLAFKNIFKTTEFRLFFYVSSHRKDQRQNSVSSCFSNQHWMFLLPQILTVAPNVDSSAAENSPQTGAAPGPPNRFISPETFG